MLDFELSLLAAASPCVMVDASAWGAAPGLSVTATEAV